MKRETEISKDVWESQPVPSFEDEEGEPPALIDRPKRGFSIPLGAWLRGALKSWGDTMLESDALLETWFQPSAVNAVWSAHQRGEDHAERLWPVLIAMQWLRSTTTSSS